MRSLSTIEAKIYNSKFMLRFLLFATLICCNISALNGQRTFATIDSSSLGEELKFDTNQVPIRELPVNQPGIPDLNFSPNIVFTPDSQRAFVSYPSSNKVLAFDAKTGNILGLLEVGKNPALITLTPDGKKIAVVCLFLKENLPEESGTSPGNKIGAISVIDVESLEVTTLNLQGVFFSFTNNIVFSEDSSTGFIGSSGTDQILRFDVSTMLEVSPRIQFNNPVRPSSITMAPNFSFFGVVLVGSPGLVPAEVPDSIQIVDPTSFQIIKSIVPESESPLFPHDFYSTNNLAISEDSKIGLIADREMATLPFVQAPKLDMDHALLIDLETGVTLAVLDVPGVSGVAKSVPGKNSFVVVSGLDISLIDSVSYTVKNLSSAVTEFTTSTRPFFSQDGSRMFINSPIEDTLLELDLETMGLKRPKDVGPGMILVVDGTEYPVPAAPLDVVISPDEEVLVVLKFNANTIELMRSTQKLFIPRLQSTSTWFTGLALTNNSGEKAEVIATGIHRTGGPFVDSIDTEDVVEFVNPKVITLEKGEQLAITIESLLEAPPGIEVDGWLNFDSDQPEISSFFLIGDREVKRMDGGVSENLVSQRLILPQVRVKDGFDTEIFVVNLRNNTTNAKIKLFDKDGNLSEELDRDIAPLSQYIGSVKGIFSNVDFDSNNWDTGYIEVTSSLGTIAFESYFDEKRMASLNAIDVANVGNLPTSLYLPQVVAFRDYTTVISLLYLGESTSTVALSLKGDDGEDLAFPISLEMDPGQFIQRTVVDLFNLNDNEQSEVYNWAQKSINQTNGLIGWVHIESESPGVVSTAELTFSEQAMTTISAHQTPAKNFTFSHVAEALEISTGIALLNPGNEQAIVELNVHDKEGTSVGSVSLSLMPKEKLVKMLKELLPNLPTLLAGYITVNSDQDVLGLEIFFADNLDFLAAVPAQKIDQECCSFR